MMMMMSSGLPGTPEANRHISYIPPLAMTLFSCIVAFLSGASGTPLHRAVCKAVRDVQSCFSYFRQLSFRSFSPLVWTRVCMFVMCPRPYIRRYILSNAASIARNSLKTHDIKYTENGIQSCSSVFFCWNWKKWHCSLAYQRRSRFFLSQKNLIAIHVRQVWKRACFVFYLTFGERMSVWCTSIKNTEITTRGQ